MTAHPKQSALFPTILASTVHDIKNSLGTLLGQIHQLAQQQDLNQNQDFQQLEFEANRINHSLMQLLVMYKIDSSTFSLAIDEYPAIDIINEARAQQDRLACLNNVEVRVECGDDLMCYCDYQHISNALGAVLNNAQRYTRTTVMISADEDGGYTRFCIEDDGEGYPQQLLIADLANPADMNWVSGNTGLGLYFVSAIARLHESKGKRGFVRIDNRSCLGGARFCLFLP